MKNVLFVQTEQDNYNYIKKTLKKDGYKAVYVQNGSQALDYIRHTTPDIIIADIFNPQTNGLEICNERKKNKDLSKIPFIVLTKTNIALEESNLVETMGVSKFLIEPIDPKELSSIINETIKRSENSKVYSKPARVASKPASELKVTDIINSGVSINALTEFSPDTILALNGEFKILYANRALPGLSIECMLNIPFYKFVEKENQTGFRQALLNIANSLKSAEYPVKYKTTKNEIIHYQCYGAPVVQDQKLQFIILYLKDNTKQAHIEDYLRHSKLRQRILTESSFEGLAIVTGGVITQVNHIMQDLLCRHASELIGNKLTQFVAPAGISEINRALNAVYTVYSETVLLRKTGEPVPVELLARNFTGDQSDTRIFAFKDITERREAEKTLLKQKAMLESAQNELAGYKNLHDALVIGEQRLKIALDGASLQSWEANLAERQIFFDITDLLHTNKKSNHAISFLDFAQYIHPQDLDKAAKPLYEIYRNLTDYYKAEYRTIDGKYLLAKGAVSQRSKDGKPLIITGVTLDITDIKQTENELILAKKKAEDADKTKMKFLANMSHELRTPMNAILGYARLLSRESGLTEKQKKDLQIINRSGEHLLNLINDVLNVSQIESGNLQINNEKFNLLSLLNDIHVMMKIKVHEKGLKFITRYAADLPDMIIGDKKKLRQILINLLNNSVKFTAKGYVEFTVTRDNSIENPPEDAPEKSCLIKFRVEDTGRGIPVNEGSLIFDPFYQASNRDEADEGTGLGLAISKQFVKLMNGDLNFQSLPNKGTIFYFTVSLESAAESVNENLMQASFTLSPDHRSYNVLIAENDAYNRSLLVRLLTQAGLNIIESPNGKVAIEHYQKQRPDLILMDMRMPVMDGYTAVSRIRKIEGELLHTPIIAVTASAFDKDRKQILDVGCDDIIRKPYKDETLFKMISKYLGATFIQNTHEQPAPENHEASSKVLSPDTLKGLPPELLQQLAFATEKLDIKLIKQTIDDIEQEHWEVSEVLRSLAGEFKYKIIWEMLQEAMGERAN